MRTDNPNGLNQTDNVELRGTQILEERGIYVAAVEIGWKPQALSREDETHFGWAFPIRDLHTGVPYVDPQTGKTILRWKNFDSNPETWRKSSWIPAQHGCPPYYAHASLRDALVDSGGVLYIAAGEPDLLSFVSAGIYNAATWLNGEGNIPKDLAEKLIDLGVTRVIYFPDRDETGKKSATKTAEKLFGSGIQFKAYQLPDFLPVKGDINDLWKHCEFDAAKFKAELERIQSDPTARIEEEAKPIRPSPRGSQAQQNARVSGSNFDPGALHNAWIRSEVMPLVNRQAPVAKGEHRHCPSPQHDDEDPSFRISYDIDVEVGIPQCSCDIQNEPKPWDKVADWVGARPFRVWWRDEKRPNLIGPKVSSNAPTLDETDDSDEYDEDEPKAVLTKGGRPKAPTDDEVGDMLLTKWAGEVRFIHDKWYRYDRGVWTEVINIEVLIWDAMREAKALDYHPSKTKGASVQDYLKSKLYTDSSVVNQATNYINLTNGLYNLVTQMLEPHQPNLFFTRQMGFAYDPEATCPRWNAFLRGTFTDENGNTIQGIIDLLQEAIGYSLTPDTNLQKGFWLYGKPASGKSTILGVLKALLGSAYMTVDFSQLRTNAYQLAMIPGRLVIACAEGKAGGKLEDHILKCLISGEEMQVRQIYGTPFVHKSRAKVWWAMNELPVNSDRSGAMDHRLVIIPFNHSVPKDQRDPHLIDKLVSELPGIFNWALQGLQRVLQKKAFTAVVAVEQEVTRYQQENDTELMFLEDQEWCEMSPAGMVKGSDFYTAYAQWCFHNGHVAKNSSLVTRDWERLGLTKVKKKDANYWRGVSLTNNAQGVVGSYRQNVSGRPPRRANFNSANL